METKAAAERSFRVTSGRTFTHSFPCSLIYSTHICCGCAASLYVFFHGTSVQRNLGIDWGSQVLALEGIFLQMETVVIC